MVFANRPICEEIQWNSVSSVCTNQDSRAQVFSDFQSKYELLWIEIRTQCADWQSWYVEKGRGSSEFWKIRYIRWKGASPHTHKTTWLPNCRWSFVATVTMQCRVGLEENPISSPRRPLMSGLKAVSTHEVFTEDCFNATCKAGIVAIDCWAERNLACRY